MLKLPRNDGIKMTIIKITRSCLRVKSKKETNKRKQIKQNS